MFDILASAASALAIETPADIWHHIINDFSNLNSPAAMTAFLQVLMIDITLAGDNAVVVGALAAGLPPGQRRKVIAVGVIAALVLRVVFALAVTWLLGIVGLILAGGLLLLWVAFRMYRDIRSQNREHAEHVDLDTDPKISGLKPSRTFASAAWSVAIADVSMSLDNVLAVAGAAREHPGILIVGLIVAVAMMGVAANVIAKYIERFRWIAWVGLIVIVYVALKMIWDGFSEVSPLLF